MKKTMTFDNDDDFFCYWLKANYSLFIVIVHCHCHCSLSLSLFIVIVHCHCSLKKATPYSRDRFFTTYYFIL